MKLSDDIHGTVFDLVGALVHASERGDTRAKWRLYGELRDFCEAEAKAGREHPFLWKRLPTSPWTVASQSASTTVRGRWPSKWERRNTRLRSHSNWRGDTSNWMSTPVPARTLAADEQAGELRDLDLRREISQFLLDHLAVSR